MDTNQLLETWEIHNRINLFLLDAIAPEHLKDVSASKGRNAGEQFAHLHNVRLMWLYVNSDTPPEFSECTRSLTLPVLTAFLAREFQSGSDFIQARLQIVLTAGSAIAAIDLFPIDDGEKYVAT
jgi:uncharacterized damage-inducible protein DinB